MEGSDTEASASRLDIHCPRMECTLSLGIHQHRPLLPECPVLTALETESAPCPSSLHHKVQTKPGVRAPAGCCPGRICDPDRSPGCMTALLDLRLMLLARRVLGCEGLREDRGLEP